MPVIFLTSKDEEVDELMGLRLGADDYITKPFSQRLLIERIRALLRRNEASRAEGSGAAPGGVMVRGDLMLDETKHQCTWRGRHPADGHRVPAGQGARGAAGMVKIRDQLIDAAYGENIYVDDRTIDSHIKRIRKKFRAGTTSSTRSRRFTASATATRSSDRRTMPRQRLHPAWLPTARRHAPRQRWVSPLLRRILLVNALPLALLVAALLYLDQYQNGLLEAEVRRCASRRASLPARWARARSARGIPTTRSWCRTSPGRCCAG